MPTAVPIHRLRLTPDRFVLLLLVAEGPAALPRHDAVNYNAVLALPLWFSAMKARGPA